MSFNPAIFDLISVAGSAPAPEVPTTISGLAMWFKADVMDTVNDLDLSGNVITWRDQSGNGRDVTQATDASRPAWIAGNASGNINGLPTVHFNTGTKILARANSNVLQNKDGWTAIAFYRFSTSAAVNSPVFFASVNGAPTTGRASIRNETTGRVGTAWRRLDGDSVALIGYVANPNNGDISLQVGRLDFRSGSLESMVRYNGVTTAGGTPSAGLTSNTTSDTVALGRVSTIQWFGHLGEILLYDRALSDAELAQVETYLIGRWGAYT